MQKKKKNPILQNRRYKNQNISKKKSHKFYKHQISVLRIALKKMNESFTLFLINCKFVIPYFTKISITIKYIGNHVTGKEHE